MEATQLSAQEFTLHDYLEVVKRRKWTILQTVAVVAVLGAVSAASTRPMYQAESKLLVQASPYQLNTVDTENPLADLLALAQPLTIETQLQLLQSGPFLDQVFRRADGKGTKEVRIPASVSVEAIPETNVIRVSATSPDPKRASSVANAVLDEYEQQTQVANLEEIQRARKFVEREGEKARRALAQAEDALLVFKRSHRVAELTAEQQSRTQELVALETRASEVDGSITRVEAQIRQVEATLRKEPAEKLVATSRENTRVDALQGRLLELEMQRTGMVEEYQESSPRVALLDAQIARLRQQLAREPQERRVLIHVLNPARTDLLGRLRGLETDLEGLRANQLQLHSELENRGRRMDQLGPWEIQLGQMNRARESAEKQYLMLTSKAQDLRIRENARRSTSRAIERATSPGGPIGTNKSRSLTLSLMLGLALGCSLAFLQEYLDDRIRTPDEVDRLLRLPVVGHIPRFSGEQPRLITALPAYSPIAESYRSLRTSISFAAIEAPLRTILVTSAHQGEGKSTTAVNLAIAMAMEGRRVILVDADLRRPSLHRALELPMAPGLTDVLVGSQAVEKALQATELPGLRVLTSGPIPPNPAEILNSGLMTALIGELQEKADVVLFDTPPCLPVTDAQVLASKVEGVLLVAALGETKKAELKQARELFDRAHARTIGLIFNKIQKGSGSYSYYAYRHSGYGPEEEAETSRNGAHALPRTGALSGARRHDGEEEA
jgi:succinoglycan biosynthesis transport protein ExoP